MAKINQFGNITATCSGCGGSISTFEYLFNGSELGNTQIQIYDKYNMGHEKVDVQFRLFRCAGCGVGALGAIEMTKKWASYPNDIRDLQWFMPEAKQRLKLPKDIPDPILKEFREGEKCFEEDCNRAAVGMFRSVLIKTLRANGYKLLKSNLVQQINDAAKDGIIPESRRRRANDETRVLGSDVFQDEWQVIKEQDVEAVRHYCRRILEDFYDDRISVLKLLREAGRISPENKLVVRNPYEDKIPGIKPDQKKATDRFIKVHHLSWHDGIRN